MNTASYILRDKNGIMRGEVASRLALRIMDSSKGFFRDVKYADRTVIGWESKEAMKYGTNDFQIYIWEGDLLVPATR